jgi:hypothetical protein
MLSIVKLLWHLFKNMFMHLLKNMHNKFCNIYQFNYLGNPFENIFQYVVFDTPLKDM